MPENQVKKSSSSKRIKQPPSVPFLWEERPGTPKKDWKPSASSPPRPLPPPLPPPVKFVASVPFKWEEQPGKPRSSFVKPSRPPPPPPNIVIHNLHENGVHGHPTGQDWMSELDLENFNFETDGPSFSSAPSLLANCLVSSSAISTAVPVENQSSDSLSDLMQTVSLPDSESDDDSSTSSYVTGSSSLVGASFLECLFPFLPPNSGFLENVAYTEKSCSSPSPSPPAVERADQFDGESNSSVMVRRPPTLGELIMMSRRRSMRRKAIEMKKRNPSMEYMEKRASGCWMFGTKMGVIEGLQKKMKWQPILRLV